jgi:MFS transporter, Spinster family, sphingosine-1-phosphate transporter
MARMPKGYARYALAVMVGINFLNYMDRYVPTAVSPIIQKEFHLNDTSVGLLASSFLIIYAICALPFGYWADRGVRKIVIGTGVTIWSLATLFTGLAQNFTQLFISRAVVGIGEASYYPAGTSLLGDYFPKNARGRAMSIWGAGTAFGIAVGFIGGGLIADAVGWRAAFFVTAIPGIFFGILAFTLREPLRGSAEPKGPKVAHAHAANLRNFVGLLRIRTLRYTILAQVFLFFVLATDVSWLPIYMVRHFAIKPSTAATISGGLVVVGGLIGTLGGGWIADWRSKIKARGNLEVSLAGFLVASVSVALAILAPSLTLFVPVFLVSVVALYLYNGPFTAIGQNVVPPSLRASAVTMSLFLAHLLGDSWSPAAVGFLSDRLGSLQIALLITSTPLLLVAAFFTYLGFRTIERDTTAMEDTWAAGKIEALPI